MGLFRFGRGGLALGRAEGVGAFVRLLRTSVTEGVEAVLGRTDSFAGCRVLFRRGYGILSRVETFLVGDLSR